jgi:hypothetical protein
MTGTETVTPIMSVTPTTTFSSHTHGALHIGRVRGEAGSFVSVDVTLDVEEGVEIAGTQNDIFVGHGDLALVENTDGDPACAINPEIAKEDTRFAFQPPGCGVDGSCTGIRAIVVSFANVDPIPSGVVLYTCTVAIASGAQQGVVHALPCSNADASNPDGDEIAVDCTDGAIEVAGVAPTPTLPSPGGSTSTPTPTVTPTPTSCHAVIPLVAPVTSPTDQLEQTIYLCGIGLGAARVNACGPAGCVAEFTTLFNDCPLRCDPRQACVSGVLPLLANRVNALQVCQVPGVGCGHPLPDLCVEEDVNGDPLTIEQRSGDGG